MALLSYQTLQNEYFKSLKVNYKYNSDKHPLYVLLKSSYKGLKVTQYIYYFEYLLSLIVCIRLAYYLKDHYVIGTLIIFSYVLIITYLFLSIFNVALHRELGCLEERISLVQEKVKSCGLELEHAIEMIDSIGDIDKLGRANLIKLYYSKLNPPIGETKAINDKFPPTARLICLETIIEPLSLHNNKEELTFLLGSLLMIGPKELKNHRTFLKKIDKVLKSEICLSKKELEELSNFIEPARRAFKTGYNKLDEISNILNRMK
jgi:hypothetical protein